jgi:hypothetical protein
MANEITAIRQQGRARAPIGPAGGRGEACCLVYHSLAASITDPSNEPACLLVLAMKFLLLGLALNICTHYDQVIHKEHTHASLSEGEVATRVLIIGTR